MQKAKEKKEEVNVTYEVLVNDKFIRPDRIRQSTVFDTRIFDKVLFGEKHEVDGVLLYIFNCLPVLIVEDGLPFLVTTKGLERFVYPDYRKDINRDIMKLNDIKLENEWIYKIKRI